MLIKTLPVGMLAANCYIVTDRQSMKCAVIDPGAESNTILDYIESNGLAPAAVFLTHGHFDHRLALDAVLEAYDMPVYLSEKEVDRSGKHEQYKVTYDKNMSFCKDGDEIELGSLLFTVMETPGHSEGSIVFHCIDRAAKSYPMGSPGVLFTGDTLFCGDCGRTDLPGGSREEMLQSLCRISGLDGDLEIYPGHDEPSTLANERMYNLDMKIAMGEVEV